MLHIPVGFIIPKWVENFNDLQTAVCEFHHELWKDKQKMVLTKEQEQREKASKEQVGGDHYKGMAIQPDEFIYANHIGFHEGNVIKYVCRWRSKGGLDDLRKAKHFIDLLIERSEAYDLGVGPNLTATEIRERAVSAIVKHEQTR